MPGRLLKRLPLTLLAAILIWFALRPVLDSAVAGFAQILIRTFEYPRVTRLVVQDHRAEVLRADFRSDSGIPTVGLTQVHFNTIVLLSLYLAMPGQRLRTRLERLFMGWSILYLTQALNLVFHVKCIYALGLGAWSEHAYSDLARNVFGYLRYFTDLPGRFSFPFLIWFGFNWDDVLRLLGLQTRSGKPASS